MNKILLSASAFIFLSLSAGVVYYKNQYENALKELGSVQASLSIQNEAIKQKSLELAEYTKRIDEINFNIENRYKEIKTTHKNCESELAEIKKTLEIFHTR